MARTGVTYFDISQAATTLSDQGREPTVDTVRAMLGTGSKSTIGPLLKQWKAKFAGVVSEEKSGLPRELLATVKGLYEGMQQQAHAQIEAIHRNGIRCAISSPKNSRRVPFCNRKPRHWSNG